MCGGLVFINPPDPAGFLHKGWDINANGSDPQGLSGFPFIFIPAR
jgi:hypothetical protein